MKLFLSWFALTAILFTSPAFTQHTGGPDIRDSVQKKDPVISNPASKVPRSKKEHRHVVGSDMMRSQKEQMKMQVLKVYTCPDHPHLVTDKPGRCPECGTLLNRTSKEKMKMQVMGLYACTVHPHVSGKKMPNAGSADLHYGSSNKSLPAKPKQQHPVRSVQNPANVPVVLQRPCARRRKK
jgi:hypothetical protein